MKRSHVSPTLLVLVYVVFIVAGVIRVITGEAGLLLTVGLGLNIIVLSALLLMAGAWAREVGILASWLKIGLGGIVMVLGALSVLTLNILDGLITIVIGAANAGVGFWTIVVLGTIAQEQRAARFAGDGSAERP